MELGTDLENLLNAFKVTGIMSGAIVAGTIVLFPIVGVPYSYLASKKWGFKDGKTAAKFIIDLYIKADIRDVYKLIRGSPEDGIAYNKKYGPYI
ncbi:MAG: hypothetical protein AABY07_00655 [Nanoarchaeota archaeon]